MIKIPPSTIYLIGMPGAGKSTFGKDLAQTIGYQFIDTDEEISNIKSKSVSKIFTEEGENHFRELEHNFIQKKFHKTVIATGGGLPCFFDNILTIKQNGFVVFIHRNEYTLLQQIMTTQLTERPLFTGLSKESIVEKVKKLLKEREPFYFQADMFINPESVSVQRLAEIFFKV